MSLWHITEWAIFVVLTATIYFLSAGVTFAAMYRWPNVFNGLVLSRIYSPLEALSRRSQKFMRLYNDYLNWCYFRSTGYENTVLRPFIPHDQVRILVSDAQLAQALAIIRNISIEGHFTISEWGGPGEGRAIHSTTLRITAETHILFENVRDPQTFDLIAYSHEADHMWRPTWMALIKELSLAFGPESVVRE